MRGYPYRHQDKCELKPRQSVEADFDDEERTDTGTSATLPVLLTSMKAAPHKKAC
jgi:hypothetical protein